MTQPTQRSSSGMTHTSTPVPTPAHTPAPTPQPSLSDFMRKAVLSPFDKMMVESEKAHRETVSQFARTLSQKTISVDAPLDTISRHASQEELSNPTCAPRSPSCGSCCKAFIKRLLRS